MSTISYDEVIVKKNKRSGYYHVSLQGQTKVFRNRKTALRFVCWFDQGYNRKVADYDGKGIFKPCDSEDELVNRIVDEMLGRVDEC